LLEKYVIAEKNRVLMVIMTLCELK